MDYAIIKASGKQYKVAVGNKILINRIAGEVGSTITINDVLMVGSAENGDKTAEAKFGRPMIDGASVVAKIVSHPRGPKAITFKKRRRKGYTKRQGHRQDLTEISVESVNG
jgi:large subunit ribosomal protein L21